jgi:hypothetical protein
MHRPRRVALLKGIERMDDMSGASAGQAETLGLGVGILVAAAILRAAGWSAEDACSEAACLEVIIRRGPLAEGVRHVAF